MRVSYLLWLLGIVIAALVGYNVLVAPIDFVNSLVASFNPDGAAKALLLALGLVAISKLF
ncbi:hypothetical protein JDN40_13720 [Rhodomicrobium vannielii ATCC 17100]|uniref:hypothetical protein n=1 Tax=Rhodomicrobium vannielii TaxID=1069 RepID=UPI00191936BC|nr:hypothetical protein [Rhodomicrobium vannielii]MBJ7535167.1 hypothetical protein [Rhodomicrobium vannielii ATCC 17100]